MTTAVDPICNMEVETSNPPGGQSEHEGTTCYFCAPGCRIAFEKDPEKYLADDWEGIDMGPQNEGDGHAGHPPEGHQLGAPEKRGSFLSRLFGRGS